MEILRSGYVQYQTDRCHSIAMIHKIKINVLECMRQKSDIIETVQLIDMILMTGLLHIKYIQQVLL